MRDSLKNNQKITGVTFIIVRPSGEMLLQLRDNNSRYYPNRWCFPGESNRNNEKAIGTVVRGVKEEFSIAVRKENCSFLTINHLPEISQEIHVFICKIDSEQTPELKEGKELRWMTIEEVKKLQLGFKQNKILSLLEEYLKYI